MAETWRKVRTVRRAVTGALEIERKDKRIGASLEAAPTVHDRRSGAAFGPRWPRFRRDLHHLRHHRAGGQGPQAAFRLEDVPTVAVEPTLAAGTKCARSWKVTTDVGSDPAFPDVSARDAAALRELGYGA